mgnify:CR=1 FL=1|jgi:hypothetical protein
MKQTNEIEGWFDYPNTFKFLINSIPDSGIFVECGAWLGKSSSFLCDNAKTYGYIHQYTNGINVFIVDTWEGSSDELDTTHKLATETDIYPVFLDNMGNRKFTPIKKTSIEASKDFQDESCDVVYIDMQHSYEAVKEDIEHWLPKVKKGGYISGHDYPYAPGVAKAVHEVFSIDDIQRHDLSTWTVRKV